MYDLTKDVIHEAIAPGPASLWLGGGEASPGGPERARKTWRLPEGEVLLIGSSTLMS